MGMTQVAQSATGGMNTRKETRSRPLDSDRSDTGEHRRRVESRNATVPGLRLPTWDQVENRKYDEWTVERIVIDTSGSIEECFDKLLQAITRWDAQTNSPAAAQ